MNIGSNERPPYSRPLTALKDIGDHTIHVLMILPHVRQYNFSPTLLGGGAGALRAGLVGMWVVVDRLGDEGEEEEEEEE